MALIGPRHVAVWTDPHQAIRLAFEAEPFDRSAMHNPGGRWFQERLEVRQYPGKQQYYVAVLSHLEPREIVLRPRPVDQAPRQGRGAPQDDFPLCAISRSPTGFSRSQGLQAKSNRKEGVTS